MSNLAQKSGLGFRVCKVRLCEMQPTGWETIPSTITKMQGHRQYSVSQQPSSIVTQCCQLVEWLINIRNSPSRTPPISYPRAQDQQSRRSSSTKYLAAKWHSIIGASKYQALVIILAKSPHLSHIMISYCGNKDIRDFCHRRQYSCIFVHSPRADM
jgi:hypothetical protein